MKVVKRKHGIDVGDLVKWKKGEHINKPGLVLRAETLGQNKGFWILWSDGREAWSPSILLQKIKGTSHGKNEATTT